MFVKICGITRLEDALAAVRCGADAIGFMCWPDSPRWIEPGRAQSIVAQLPPFVTPVGVFVNQPVEEVNEVVAVARLGAVQLHGDETADYAKTIHRPVVKTMDVALAADAAVDQVWPSPAMILLDAHDPVKRGGTGRTIDWAAAAAVAARRRVLLAGGLTPENVASAVNIVKPYGIDLASGVEDAPGVKNHGRLRALFEAIHDSSHHSTRS